MTKKLLLAIALLSCFSTAGHAQSQFQSPGSALVQAEPDGAVPFTGTWNGKFEGDKFGTLTVTVSADNVAKIHCVSGGSGRTVDISVPVEETGVIAMSDKSSVLAGMKVIFHGMLTHSGTASGTWEVPFLGVKGTWEAKRRPS